MLYSALHEYISCKELFLDVLRLPPGCDFEAELEAAVDACIGLVAVVGNGWAEGISNPNDWVRREICAARRKCKPILPVCVGGATLPSTNRAPEDIDSALMRFKELCVHISQYRLPDIQPIISWVNGLRHGLSVAGVRFHRICLPAKKSWDAEILYLSEDILFANQWGCRLQEHLTDLKFNRNCPSTSAVAMALLKEVNSSLYSRESINYLIDMAFPDELERGASLQFCSSGGAPPEFGEIVVSEPQLCRMRRPFAYATIALNPDATDPENRIIVRKMGLSENDCPFRLVLRTANRQD